MTLVYSSARFNSKVRIQSRRPRPVGAHDAWVRPNRVLRIPSCPILSYPQGSSLIVVNLVDLVYPDRIVTHPTGWWEMTYCFWKPRNEKATRLLQGAKKNDTLGPVGATYLSTVCGPRSAME